MALHDELAELRAEVGPQVFDDPVAFRAAFDDFIPEGSASTGEVSLLVGAIATGALQRLKEQLALGADAQTSIAVQADLLARDRGTSESSGARWAMSVLAYAIGALPGNGVPTRQAPGPDSIGTADRPTAGAGTEAVDPDETYRVDATRVVAQEPPPPSTAPPSTAPPSTAPTPATPARRGAGPLLIAVLAVVVVIAVVAATLLVLRDGDSPDDDTTAEDTTTEDTKTETTSPVSINASPTSVALGVLSTVDFRVAGKPFQLSLLLDGTTGAGSTTSASQMFTAYIELAAGLHGERGMVDRIPASCPYFGDSYGAVVQHTGGGQFLVAWRTRDDNDYSEYGEVLPFEELVTLSGNDAPCATSD